VSLVESDEVGSLEGDFKALRTEYEKYFAGVERLEPLKERDRVKSTLRRLMTVRTPNTAHRYRLQTLQASMITYESYWNRITRQIEEGTYHRDLFKLAHKQQTLAASAEPRVAAPAPQAQPAAAVSPPAAAPANAGAVYPEALRSLHNALVKARAETGDTRPLTIDSLAATLKKQMSTIKEKFKCERVEFTVTVKDGKAVLKAIPR
jgi:hypothetical protein